MDTGRSQVGRQDFVGDADASSLAPQSRASAAPKPDAARSPLLPIASLAAYNPTTGIGGLKALLTKVQTDAKTLVSQAKSDFPSQTSAINPSVDAFASDLKALPANPSASRIATLAPSAGMVVGWIQVFVNATNSKCS